MAKGKITRDQVEARLTWVEDQLTELVPLPALYRAFRREFKASQRCAERYVRRVHDRWAAEAPADREAKRAQIERAADLTFRDARREREPRVQVAALDLKAKLHGLYRPEEDGDEGGDVELVIECEPRPPEDRVPVAPDVAPGGDPPGH